MRAKPHDPEPHLNVPPVFGRLPRVGRLPSCVRRCVDFDHDDGNSTREACSSVAHCGPRSLAAVDPTFLLLGLLTFRYRYRYPGALESISRANFR